METPSVIFRADASVELGSGHVMRCLALADAFRSRGMYCHFVCGDYDGHLGARIREEGHGLSLFNPDSQVSHRKSWTIDRDATIEAIGASKPEWIIVDHYGLDQRWENELLPYCHQLMVIDDLIDRHHSAHVLLNQNLGVAKHSYDTLVPRTARVLLGPRYALMRGEFAAHRANSLAKRTAKTLDHIVISMGGMDSSNVTSSVLHSLRFCRPSSGFRVTAVLGRYAPFLANVQLLAATMPFQCDVAIEVADMAALLTTADLAIGGGGISAWERCALGVPSVVVVVAENQRIGAQALRELGASVIMEITDIPDVLPKWLQGRKRCALLNTGDKASKVTDGVGVLRVINALSINGCTIREVDKSDLQSLLEWRNTPIVRNAMYSKHEISAAEHSAWFAASVGDRTRARFIVESVNGPLGFVQFTLTGTTGEADWGFYLMPGARRGSGSKLGLTALNHAFTELGLTAVYGEALISNQKSIAFHEALGFRQDGPLKTVFRAGRDHSIYRFILSKDEWNAHNG